MQGSSMHERHSGIRLPGRDSRDLIVPGATQGGLRLFDCKIYFKRAVSERYNQTVVGSVFRS